MAELIKEKTRSTARLNLRKPWTRTQWMLLWTAIPFVAFVTAFYYVPVVGWILAFFKFRPGIPLFQNEFVGLHYFEIMFTSEWPQLQDALINTLALSGLSLLVTPLPVVLAIMMNEVRSAWFRKFVQTTTTLPNFISFVLVFAIFFVFFSSEGMIHQLLSEMGFVQISILADPDKAWFFQTFISAWKVTGWGAIIYLAAIAGIDQELYDAAEVDGAGRFRKIRHITIPGILPTFVVLFVLNVGLLLGNSAMLEQYLIFMNPLVQDKLEVIDYYTYRIGLAQGQISYATAIGMTKSILSIVLLFVTNAIVKAIRGSSVI